MPKTKCILYFSILGVLLLCGSIWTVGNVNLSFQKEIGDRLDSLNGVMVYYNGPVNNVTGRNTTYDGYNLGLKYQCVEFVKRYYYEYFNHKMPNSYGHAKSFFEDGLEDGMMNAQRDLRQFINGNPTKPQVNDLIVFDGNVFNPYGHVAIISQVSDHEIEIIQQNPGPYGNSRELISMSFENHEWTIERSDVLGYLRKVE